MTKIKTLTAAALTAAVLFAPLSARAHCDSIDGPVAKAAQTALETGNVHLALPYAPASAEGEMRAAFAQALKVRALGPDAKTLADKAFIETTVRLHRMGEGAPYTGLKPAGTDYGPAIPAAERAVEKGNLSEVKAVLAEEIEHGLHGRFAHVRETQNAPRAPKAAEEVPAARARVNAELGFVTYVEGVRQAIHGAGHAHKD
ncbi:MAG TPA: DUF6448 family protein [Xanthobacteraceae bacterium]|nr:DUF6448 family protein [Xanthobacteraceae bacterium]